MVHGTYQNIPNYTTRDLHVTSTRDPAVVFTHVGGVLPSSRLPARTVLLGGARALGDTTQQHNKCGLGSRAVRAQTLVYLLGTHAKNNIAGPPNYPFLVLGFYDKKTGICASAMPYR